MTSFSEISKHKKKAKTYSSRSSLGVAHPNTNQPIQGLCMTERTRDPVFLGLWPYVLDFRHDQNYTARRRAPNRVVNAPKSRVNKISCPSFAVEIDRPKTCLRRAKEMFPIQELALKNVAHLAEHCLR